LIESLIYHTSLGEETVQSCSVRVAALYGVSLKDYCLDICADCSLAEMEYSSVVVSLELQITDFHCGMPLSLWYLNGKG
jgi:hypothetical protein